MLGKRPKAKETDRVLNALSHADRRRLLFELYEAVEEDSINYTEISLPKNTLCHVHLPKLGEFGYIKWNKAEETIQKGPQWEEIEPVLELIDSHLCELPKFLQGKHPIET